MDDTREDLGIPEDVDIDWDALEEGIKEDWLEEEDEPVDLTNLKAWVSSDE